MGFAPTGLGPAAFADIIKKDVARWREIVKTRAHLNRILSENTGQPLEKIELDTERDYYLSATESKDYGLIDEVISKRA